MDTQIRITGEHYNILKEHLFPKDGKEAVAVALCGRFSYEKTEYLLVNDLTLIPYNECSSRDSEILIWSTKKISPYFEKISRSNMAIMKIHSHPGGYDEFSDLDNNSDHEFFESVFGWAINDKPHASAIMLPDGSIKGRFFSSDLSYTYVDKISIAGDTIIKYKKKSNERNNDFALRTIQTFGDKTYRLLSNLKIGVVGCSGTGSPIIEQLVRLGVGSLFLVDSDIVEFKNLNRIINSKRDDAILKHSKVEAISNAINGIGLGTKVITSKNNLYNDIHTLKSLVKCDVIFGCMDTVDGRHLLNQLCSFYLIPYFDIGVSLEADGKGGINKVCATVHYIQPFKSSLLTRGVYTIEDLKASSQYRKNPEEYENLKKNSYIKNLNVNSPAVISINMEIASHAVNEFLNRIHPYKSEKPSNYAVTTIDMTENCIINLNELDLTPDEYLKKRTGKGDITPFIEFSELTK